MKTPKKATEKKIGRPSKYSDEIADKICELIATSSKGLHAICESADFPTPTTIFRWLADEDKTSFRDKYARAREQQADLMAAEIIEIADKCREGKKKTTRDTKDGTFEEVTTGDMVDRSRLMVDSRKWLASKLAPKKYGDKLDLTTAGEKIANVVPTAIQNATIEELKELLKKADESK